MTVGIGLLKKAQPNVSAQKRGKAQFNFQLAPFPHEADKNCL